MEHSLQKDILWVEWTQKNLTKGKKFWELKILANCSSSWRHILRGRKEASYIIRHCIRDGEYTLWSNPCQHRGILKDDFLQVLFYHSSCDFQVKVSALIINGERWLRESLQRVAPNIAKIIVETIIEGGADEPSWTVLKHGEFNLKEMYEEPRRKKAPTVWHDLPWHGNNIPRHLFHCGWDSVGL